ncbi:hypothetical protein KLP40_18840 [Hymenobacter sp. NST-14]|uniref:hypothetical protein n=1 Tax=Hymenobacter piscis TaxID=2839984 RepID=UPI001C014328|nr:hypothetical protein [Hymenobacter piscis]MBT9395233.1 hypothetical protein [Hymenobacter piscis]
MDATTSGSETTPAPKKSSAKKPADTSYTPSKDLAKLLSLASHMSDTYGPALTPNQIIEQAVVKHLLDLKKKNKLVPTRQLEDLDSMLSDQA